MSGTQRARWRSRAGRTGMILLNVLILVAIGAAAVTVMIASEDLEVRRTIRLKDAAQAQALSRAGELSAVVALRRDALQAPGSDAYSEPWAAIAQTSIAVPQGRFALAITDEQGRFNINSLVRDDAIAASRFRRIAGEAGLSEASLAAVAVLVRTLGPLRDEGLLQSVGLTPAEVSALGRMIAYLPPEARLNLNTVGADLLGVLVEDPSSVRAFLALRAAKGQVTQADLDRFGFSGLGGLTSSHFSLTTTVTVGDVTQVTLSRIERHPSAGNVQVVVTARRRVSP